MNDSKNSKNRSEHLWNPKIETESRNQKQETDIKIQNRFQISKLQNFQNHKNQKRFSKNPENDLFDKRRF